MFEMRRHEISAYAIPRNPSSSRGSSCCDFWSFNYADKTIYDITYFCNHIVAPMHSVRKPFELAGQPPYADQRGQVDGRQSKLQKRALHLLSADFLDQIVQLDASFAPHNRTDICESDGHPTVVITPFQPRFLFWLPERLTSVSQISSSLTRFNSCK